MSDFAYEASAKTKTVREIVNEFLDAYSRHLLGTKEAEALIRELENL